MVFEANEFLKGVAGVKSFWLGSKLNNLRIEAHKDTKRMDFISVNRDSGLETVVTVPAFVLEDGSITLDPADVGLVEYDGTSSCSIEDHKNGKRGC